MNTERDKFLTEAMELCWHEWDWQRNGSGMPSIHAPMICKKCKAYSTVKDACRDFSTWTSFGILSEHFIGNGTLQYVTLHGHTMLLVFDSGSIMKQYQKKSEIPSHFADALYNFLKEKP